MFLGIVLSFSIIDNFFETVEYELIQSLAGCPG